MTTVEMHFESFGEMFYYFLKKKLCPICGEKLEKHKEKEDNGFQIWNNAFNNIYMDYEFKEGLIIYIKPFSLFKNYNWGWKCEKEEFKNIINSIIYT